MRTNRLRGLVAALAVTIGGLTLLQPSPAQASAPLKWAVSDGSSMTKSSGTTGFTKLGTGRYEVTFGSNVSGCAYVASTHVSGSQAQTVFTAGGHLSANGVYVETKNQGGGLSDAPFSLFVACDDTGNAERRAVVGTTGALTRASAGTTLTKTGIGQYTVRFDRKVHTCTAIATVGDPANGIVLSPAGVYTSSAADKQAINIETKNPGGGLTDGIPFHIAVVCDAGPLFARVNVRADGTPQRGSALTSAFSTGAGDYTVVAPRSLANCAWLTTRGEVGKQVPFSPATVEATAGPAANTLAISVKSLLGFGGAPASEAFQVVAAC